MQVRPCFLLSLAGSVWLSGFRQFDRRLGFTRNAVNCLFSPQFKFNVLSVFFIDIPN